MCEAHGNSPGSSKQTLKTKIESETTIMNLGIKSLLINAAVALVLVASVQIPEPALGCPRQARVIRDAKRQQKRAVRNAPPTVVATRIPASAASLESKPGKSLPRGGFGETTGQSLPGIASGSSRSATAPN